MLESRLGFVALVLEGLCLVPFEPLDFVPGKFLSLRWHPSDSCYPSLFLRE